MQWSVPTPAFFMPQTFSKYQPLPSWDLPLSVILPAIACASWKVPCLAAPAPKTATAKSECRSGKKRNFILIDVGASPDPRPESLVDNAILGANYARVALGVRNPKVGLLCNGTEDGKGNMLVQTAHRLFKSQEGVLNYAGLVEGFTVLDGEMDVVVCDGFTGNVVLKCMEGAARMFKDILKEEIQKSWLRKLGIFLAMGAFRGMKKRLPIDKFSGAPLLGLNGLVVKAHGSSQRKQIAGAIAITLRCLRKQMHGRIKADIERLNALVEANKAIALEKEKQARQNQD